MRYMLQLFIIVLVLGNIGGADAGDSGSRESLRGIFGLGLVIEEVSPDAAADGLSQETIRSTIEQALRTKGIRLLTERARSGSTPYLYVNVNTLKEELGLYAYTVTVDLKQLVGLLAMKNKKTWGTTWSASVIGMVRHENLNQIIADGLEPLIKDFVDDYLAVNPR
jgi:hypothetical protein